MHARVSLVIAALFILVGIAEYVRPFGPPMLRNSPILMVIVGALLAARYAARAVAMSRQKMIDEVPDKPLGLDD